MKSEKLIREMIDWLEEVERNEDLDYIAGFYVCLDCKKIYDSLPDKCMKDNHTAIFCEIESCSIPDIINILKWMVKE